MELDFHKQEQDSFIIEFFAKIRTAKDEDLKYIFTSKDSHNVVGELMKDLLEIIVKHRVSYDVIEELYLNKRLKLNRMEVEEIKSELKK